MIRKIAFSFSFHKLLYCCIFSTWLLAKSAYLVLISSSSFSKTGMSSVCVVINGQYKYGIPAKILNVTILGSTSMSWISWTLLPWINWLTKNFANFDFQEFVAPATTICGVGSSSSVSSYLAVCSVITLWEFRSMPIAISGYLTGCTISIVTSFGLSGSLSNDSAKERSQYSNGIWSNFFNSVCISISVIYGA